MRIPFLLSVLATLPAQASDLWCVPEKVCIPGSCDIPINEEHSIRLTHADSIAPVLQSHGQAFAMAKTFERAGFSEWNGINASGEQETMSLHRGSMRFTHLIGGEFVPFVGQQVRYKSLGKCEMQ